MILGIPKKMLIIVAVLAGIALIYIAGSDKQNADASDGAPSGCKVTVTADVLNARSAPAIGGGIVGKYNHNATIDAQPVVKDGYRKIAENKWAKAEFLKPVDGAQCG